MTEGELQQIEDHVGFALPAYYRDTMLHYPFEPGSFADELMLPNCPEAVIDLNDTPFLENSDMLPLCVGVDGGEERYFIDASRPNSRVFVFDLETGKHRPFESTWASYLHHIRAVLRELKEDEEAERLRNQSKKWWRFW